MNEIHPVTTVVPRAVKESRQGHRGLAVWLYGLSGAGKSTLSFGLEQALAAEGRRTVVLDGDSLRSGLNRDLGFSDADRSENLRRAAEVARLFLHTGTVTICAFITPRAVQRALVRSIIGPGDLLEVYLSASVDACAGRDPKGLYAKAREGKLAQFTGVGDGFEPPSADETPLVLDTATTDAAACVAQLLARVRERINLP